MEDTDAIWRALGNPIRRGILDLLREGPLTTTGIGDHFPELSRFAVMQHLGVLEEARLVVSRKEGRRRVSHLNPVPMRELYERWVGNRAGAESSAALAMRRFVEGKEKEMSREKADALAKIEVELPIAAPPEAVFDALTKGIDDWWPFRLREGSRVFHDCRLGGFLGEDWGDGAGAIWGTIVLYDPPHRCVARGPGGVGGAYTSLNSDLVEATPEGCVYKKSLQMWGEVPEELERIFREGSRAILERHLVEYVMKKKETTK
ncbi:MAG: ArsR/SmtB family transcription factor [Fimbriimonas sp.]